MNASIEMPQYQCHKKVWALKIAKIEYSADDATIDGARITPAEIGCAPFEVDWHYVDKHKPQVGGYFVVYSDGYKSYSPAKAFEEGYTRI